MKAMIGCRWPSTVCLLAMPAFSLLTFSGTASAARKLYATPAPLRPLLADCATLATACTLPRAIALAGAGDEIVLSSGRYTDTGMTIRVPIQLVSGSTTSSPVLDAANGGQIFEIRPGPGNSVALDGLTLKKASAGAIVVTDGKLTVTNSELSHNAPYAIACANSCQGLTVHHSTLNDNSSPDDGAAITAVGNDLNQPQVEVTESTFTNNSAGFSGGAINCFRADLSLKTSELENNGARSGGGVSVINGSVTIKHSTFLGNTAAENGAGVYWSSADSAQILSTANTTFYQNQAVGEGGALYTDGPGSNQVAYCTFADNAAGGAADIYADSNFSLNASILSHPTLGAGVSECGGSQVGNMLGVDNLVDVCSDCNSDSTFCVGSLPAGCFGSLGTHGGQTKVLPVLSTGTTLACNAIDQILPVGGNCVNPATGATVLVDQRGQARPTGLRCDIGAYESK